MIKTTLADCFEGDKMFAYALQDGFAKIKDKVETTEEMVRQRMEEKTGNFFTAWFDKKELLIPEIEIPESISLDLEGEESEEEREQFE
jgi:hypothetical protein